MAVQRRVNWLSGQRVNLDDLRSVESAASNDFDQLIQGFVTGSPGMTLPDGQGYILRGFEILMNNAIGGAANSLQVLVDPGAVFHIASSQSGTVLMVPPGTPAQQLNGATNTNVQGAFSPNSFNYVGLEYIRYIDPATDAQVYIWDPTVNDETVEVAPRGVILEYNLYITSSQWASNVLPIAIVQTDSSNNVISITDCRYMLFRLGTGGASPNPFYVYPWDAQPEGRTENPPTSTSNSVNPFEGGDKMLGTLKDWMDAIMTSIEQIQGTNFWYSSVTGTPGSGSLLSLREDIADTVVTGNSTISNGVLPNTTPVLTTTGNINSNNQLTNLASTTNLVNGLVIFGPNIPANTTILSIAGSTVTMSANATATTTGISVSFYAPETITAPGQINWASNPPGGGQIYLKLIGSRLSYQIVENPTGNSVTLADNQVAYLNLTRNATIAPNLTYTVSGPNTIVQSVGSVLWTTGLQAGDWIRSASDPDSNYFEILAVNSGSQVTLTGNYAPVGGSTAAGVQSVYAYGVYTLPGQTGTMRDIQIAIRYAVPMTGNMVWLFVRADDGGSVARVYIKFLGSELQNGDSQEISGPQLNNLLQYVGSPSPTAIAPNYTATVFPGALPEISHITVGAASTMSNNQYFFIYSSGNFRKYYVWANINGGGTDPMPFADYIGIPWIITSTDTATQVAVDLVDALNANIPNDFSASYVGSVVTVTNNSAGATNPASNANVSAPFATAVVQAGTGFGNAVINDGDNLTLAIKKLDEELGNFIEALDSPNYDETINIVASGGQTPPYFGSGFPNFTPVTLNGPISASTDITLPNNTRLGNVVQKYTVGAGTLEVYLNGQFIELGIDWLEVGSLDTASTQIEILQNLVVGDYLQFRLGGGGGGGGGGGVGPAGPAGPTGPAGADAAGGPISISTKTANYTVLLSDCFLKANCASNPVTFTLPTAASAIGQIFYLKKIDSTANAMTIKANGVELIDGSNTQATTEQYASYSIISDGSQWNIF